jgi:hypothetical protein
MGVYNRLVALHAEGVRICLHCFVYGNYTAQDHLHELAAEVHYYPRRLWPVLLKRGQSFAITSRKHPKLLERLSIDKLPVWFEGTQSTGWLDDLKGRKLFLRAHNIEHRYYQHLADNSHAVPAMIYRRESQCLETYERAHARDFSAIFAVTEKDTKWFNDLGANAVYLPPFHGFHTVNIIPGRGAYILYQGDLSIESNQRAVLELVRWLGQDFVFPFIIAGKRGDKAFETRISSFSNIQRLPDVSSEKMNDLIRHAQIILIHSLHEEGVKMKIFPALYEGRFVLANKESMTHTPWDQAMQFYAQDTFLRHIHDLKNMSFDQQDIDKRTEILSSQPDDRIKAKEIIRYL